MTEKKKIDGECLKSNQLIKLSCSNSTMHTVFFKCTAPYFRVTKMKQGRLLELNYLFFSKSQKSPCLPFNFKPFFYLQIQNLKLKMSFLGYEKSTNCVNVKFTLFRIAKKKSDFLETDFVKLEFFAKKNHLKYLF